MNGSGEPQELWIVVPEPEVSLVTTTAPVPPAPPPSLAHAVSPQVGSGGRILDWRLIDPSAAGEYWAWRRHSERRLPVGAARELATLRSVALTVGHGEEDALDELLATLVAAGDEPQELSVAALGECVEALLDVRTALEITGGHGYGLFDASAPGSPPLRVWAPPVEKYVLSATITTVVNVDPIDQLVVDCVGGERRRLTRVQAVDLAVEPVEVTGDEGQVVQLTPAEARPLAWVAPSTLRWVVRQVPLCDVWAHAFESIPAAVATALEPTIVATTQVPIR